MDELEAELEMILAGGEKTVAPPRKAVTPPRRMVTPSDAMRVPHQELVNSLCQMKVLDRSGQFDHYPLCVLIWGHAYQLSCISHQTPVFCIKAKQESWF